jgi:hypothetical protein
VDLCFEGHDVVEGLLQVVFMEFLAS